MATYTWNGPASGGYWTNAANWTAGTTGDYPNGSDEAIFNTNATVNLGSNISITALFVEGANTNVPINVTLVGTSSETLSAETFEVNNNDTLTLDVNTTVGGVLGNIEGGGTVVVNGVILSLPVASVSGNGVTFSITNGGTLDYGAAPKDGSIVFGSGNNNKLEIPNDSGTISVPISGIQTGDEIILVGGGTDRIKSVVASGGKGSYTYTITLYDGDNTSVTLTNVTLPANTTVTINDNILSFVTGTPCFLKGTLIATPSGEAPVETIKVGDLVTTLTAGALVPKPVTWLGHRSVKPGKLLPDEAHPVRIKAGAFAENIPARDLLVTAEHCILFDGALIPARMLVNGRSIIVDTGISSFTYYHVELEEHAILLAEGLTTESYLDSGNRNAFTNADITALRPRLTRNSGWENAAAPLTVAPDQVRPLWAMLNARAEALGMPRFTAPAALTQDPNLRIVTSTGAEIHPVRQYEGKYVFMVPVGEIGLTLLSRCARPCDTVGPFIDDRRALGVLVGEISLYQRRKKLPLRAHLTAPALLGWHEVEAMPHRWTNGRASLPVNLSKLRGPAAVLEIQVLQAGPYKVAEMPMVQAA